MSRLVRNVEDVPDQEQTVGDDGDLHGGHGVLTHHHHKHQGNILFK